MAKRNNNKLFESGLVGFLLRENLLYNTNIC